MEISKVTEVFFSPTYSTERIVRLIGEAWEETHQEIDLSRIPKERKIHEFGAQDLIVFGVPSYGGRVPAPAAERFRNLKGQKTPIILLTAFGRRRNIPLCASMQKEGPTAGIRVNSRILL